MPPEPVQHGRALIVETDGREVHDTFIAFTDDQGSIEALQFLMTREITHMKAFTAALESLGRPRFQIGQIPPTPGLVDDAAVHEIPALPSDEEVAALAAEQEAGAAADTNETTDAPAGEATPEGDASDESKEG